MTHAFATILLSNLSVTHSHFNSLVSFLSFCAGTPQSKTIDSILQIAQDKNLRIKSGHAF